MQLSPSARLSAMQKSEIVILQDSDPVGDIEYCAETLDSMHGAQALDFWKAECRKLARQLTLCGLPPESVSEQVMEFQNLVQAALVRRHDARAISVSREAVVKKRQARNAS
jgi:hypothetical protein